MTDEDVVRLISEGLAALGAAAAIQLDPERFVADLRLIANFLDEQGDATSAALVDELARVIERRIQAQGPQH